MSNGKSQPDRQVIMIDTTGQFPPPREALGDKTFLPFDTETEYLPMGTERILFIDDEELLATLGKDMLERLGYQVTAQSSSIEALTTFPNKPDDFDLVITDQTMPDRINEGVSKTS